MQERPPTSRLQRLSVGITGGGVLLLGVVMLPLPGPGTLVILVGLSILRREFPWADRLSERIRQGSTATARVARRLGGRGRRKGT